MSLARKNVFLLAPEAPWPFHAFSASNFGRRFGKVARVELDWDETGKLGECGESLSNSEDVIMWKFDIGGHVIVCA